jgi:hypothetical protein
MYKDATWNRIRFYWSAVTGATGYRLRRKPNGDPDSSFVLIYDGDGLEYYDFPVALDYTSASNPSRTWHWELWAYNDDGESAGSSFSIHNMGSVSDANVNTMELLHPSYNDGSDKSASYSDIAKSGTGGATDPSANEAVLFNDQLWTNSI